MWLQFEILTSERACACACACVRACVCWGGGGQDTMSTDRNWLQGKF